MRLASLVTSVVLAAAVGCAKPPPPKPPPKIIAPPPPKPLTTAEMQRNVTGAARLSKSCLEKPAQTGVYVLRLFIDPSGSVNKVERRAAPSRAAEPATYAGVARYIGPGEQPDNAVARCYAAAFRKLRFRRFGGPMVAFDYPVAVERLPPSEKPSKARRCESDEDCVFRTRSPCGCPLCGKTWRRAISREAAKKRARKLRGDNRRCTTRRHRKRLRRRCKGCEEPLELVGKQALCIDKVCSVR